jgi:polysaccharide pyruvyl transferase WcaK-like protein
MLRASAAADATVLAGWSIGEEERDGALGLGAAVALLLAAKLRGHPTALLGISAGPARTRRQRRFSRWLLREADLVVLRDELSAHHLEAAGVPGPFRIGADPAWLDVHGRWRPGPAAPGPRRVVVAIEARACPPDLVGRLGEALGALARQGVEIGLQPWHGPSPDGEDHGLTAELAGRIGEPVRVLAPLPDLGAGREALAGAGAVVALGSHALIAAAAAGAVAVAVACEPAISSLARQLDQPLVAADAVAAEIAEAIAAALDHEPPRPNAVEGQIATAEEGFRLLRVLLSEGRSQEVDELSGLPLRRGPEG